MDDLVISVLLICVYVIVVGGGYLYDIIKKQVKRHKKARKIVDEVNFEIEEEKRKASLEQAKAEETPSVKATQNENKVQEENTKKQKEEDKKE